MSIDEHVEPTNTNELPTGGRWEVRLTIPVEEAETTVDAVAEFIDTINEFGINTFTFHVVHEGGDEFYVKEGATFTVKQVLDYLAEEFEEGGWFDDDEDEND